MRITGGVYRSRVLLAPRGSATRPTSDRVREGLFGILSSAGLLEEARVLDLYAGTGALALEAISRGAARATLVESSRAASATIRANVDTLGVGDQVRVLSADVTASASLPKFAEDAPFDLVFADPPWAHVDAGQVSPVLAALARSGLLAASAHLVLEHASRTTSPDIDGLTRLQVRSYGDTALSFYKPAILAGPRTGEARSPSE